MLELKYTELQAPDHAHWEAVSQSLEDQILLLDDSREIVEPGPHRNEMLMLGIFAVGHLAGSVLSIFLKGASPGLIAWFVCGCLLASAAIISGWRRFTRTRRYYLLPGQLIRIDRYGRQMLRRERVDDLITREISDNGRPAVELLLITGDWIPMKISPGEVEKVQAWFDEEQ